jgi:hypothetical protein
MKGFSNPDSFFESFFNPNPSTSFLRQAQDRQGERIEKQASDKLDGRMD